MTALAQPLDATIRLRGVSKHFGGARALDNASLTINQGEIHGLLGENGSGKSTLIKVLSGFHTPDSGEMVMNGAPVSLPMPPGLPRELGIGFVHQDLGLVPSLTVLDNLRIGTFASETSWHLSWRAERRAALELLDEYGLHVDPSTKVANLRPTERAMLAIVRAVQDIREVTSRGGGTGLLVLDETTVFLPADEKDHLFRVVREIARKSASVLFVSHDLDEVREITDTVTVLREGHIQGSVSTSKVTVSELVEMIVGRAVDIEQIERRIPAPGARRSWLTTWKSTESGIPSSLRRGRPAGRRLDHRGQQVQGQRGRPDHQRTHRGRHKPAGDRGRVQEVLRIRLQGEVPEHPAAEVDIANPDNGAFGHPGRPGPQLRDADV